MIRRVGVLVLVLALGALAAPAAGAAEDDYPIGPRDVLRVVVWGHDDLSKEYLVDADGTVPFPLIGRAKAAGLTTKGFAALLTTLLEKDYLVNPQVIVAVSQYLSKKVHVLGEGERSGTVYLTGPTTILEVISKVGGWSKAAGRQVVLVRTVRPEPGRPAGGSSIFRLDFGKIQAGDSRENIRVEDEDMIFFPKAQAFFVLGEVRTAGTFPLDKPTSVLEAVTIAGGFSERAAPSGAKVIRRTDDGHQETIPLDLSGAVPKDRDFLVQDGDTLLVPKGNTFFVFGEVRRPGAYVLEKETTILEGITIAGGFTERAAPGRVRVIRNSATGQHTLEVDMNEVIKRGKREKAVALQENDVVVVPESFF
jgi:polysaccharide export outer membrane protein